MAVLPQLAVALGRAASSVEAMNLELQHRLDACRKSHAAHADTTKKGPRKPPRDEGTILLPGGDPDYLTFFNPQGRPTTGKVGEPNDTWTDPTTGIEWHLNAEGVPVYPVKH